MKFDVPLRYHQLAQYNHTPCFDTVFLTTSINILTHLSCHLLQKPELMITIALCCLATLAVQSQGFLFHISQ